MIDLSASLSSLDSTVTLTDPFFKDIMWWHSFIESWNGRSFFMSPKWLPNTALQLYTDSAGSVGYGAYFQGHWFNGKWCTGDMSKSIQWKELYPIVLAAVTWGQLWTRKRILFLCDNEAVVHSLTSGTSRSPDVMVLLRRLFLCAAKFNFTASAKHVPGIHNTVADSLSRFQMQVFRQAAPAADTHPTTPAQMPLLNIWNSSFTILWLLTQEPPTILELRHLYNSVCTIINLPHTTAYCQHPKIPSSSLLHSCHSVLHQPL